MNRSSSHPFFDKLLDRTGRWYPILILLLIQMINTPLIILLTAMPAQQNAEFGRDQGIRLILFAGAAFAFRNILLLVEFYYFNPDLFARLAKLGTSEVINHDPAQERRAWEQATSATKHILSYEFVEFFALVLAPTLLYGYFALHITHLQIVQLGLAAVAAALTNLILENLVLDQWFKPVLQTLLPRQQEVQLIGMKGLRLKTRLTIAIMGLVMISLLLVEPSAYHQVNLFSPNVSLDPKTVTDALFKIVNAGVGAIVVGIFLTVQIVSYLSTQFRKLIELLGEVEKGNLNTRVEVSFPDEFGDLSIYINQVIGRLQKFNVMLEQKVTERTAELSEANEHLQLELAERKRAEELLAYSALHDPLTDLPNRVLFMDRLCHAMERAKRHKNFTFAVFFMDLDRFKVVNDSLGHNIGDLLLIESAHRLPECVRSEDTVARLGGDEFVLLLEEMEGVVDYLPVVKRIQKSLALPADLEGHRVFISVSTGIVLSDPQYEHPEDILRDADIAMYRAKKLGRNRYEIFDPEMYASVMTGLQLENDLRKAVERQEFIVHYQPILDLETQRIVGFEALVRWQHPTQGLTLPAEFIPTAEEIGLIVPIGYWVLEEACRQIQIWQAEYPVDPPLTVSVNISARQCTEPDLVQRIMEILQKNNLDAGSLKLELTETLVVEDSESTSAMLSELRELGIQVQIDDFGTGYSSLSYLHNLPIDTLKIDRTFISQLAANGSGNEIVRTILALAHGLGMKVIAEGVETEEQLSTLQGMDCEYFQGFLFAKALASREAGVLLGKSIP